LVIRESNGALLFPITNHQLPITAPREARR